MIEPYKISVIVPVFGTEAYLRRCLDSILNNTYRNLEITEMQEYFSKKEDTI